jgi:hypothetical protein
LRWLSLLKISLWLTMRQVASEWSAHNRGEQNKENCAALNCCYVLLEKPVHYACTSELPAYITKVSRPWQVAQIELVVMWCIRANTYDECRGASSKMSRQIQQLPLKLDNRLIDHPCNARLDDKSVAVLLHRT